MNQAHQFLSRAGVVAASLVIWLSVGVWAPLAQEAESKAKPAKKGASKKAASKANVDVPEPPEPGDDTPPEDKPEKPAKKAKSAVRSKSAKKSLLDADEPAMEKGEPEAKKKAEPRDPPPKPGETILTPAMPTPIEQLLGRPATLEQLWQVIERDFRYGRYREAKEHARALLKHPEFTPDKALELREQLGSATLVYLRSRPETRDEFRQILDKIDTATRAKARDTARLDRYIPGLEGPPSERTYALDQFRKAGPYGVPPLVRAVKEKRLPDSVFADTLSELDRSSWPAVATLVDSGDEFLAGAAIDALRVMDVRDAAEWIWFIVGARSTSPKLRADGERTIRALLGISAGSFPSPNQALAKRAEEHYQAFASATEPGPITSLWVWSSAGPIAQELPERVREAALADLRVRQALALDPTNAAALQTGVSLALTLATDSAMAKNASSLRNVALTAGPNVLESVLAKAEKEGRAPLVREAINALGAVGKQRDLGANAAEKGPLLAALDYPDRGVQFDAAIAILEIFPREDLPRAPRIVQILLRALSAKSQPVALVIDSNEARGNVTGAKFEQVGFGYRGAVSGKKGFTLAAESGAVDLIVIDPDVQNWTLDATIANLRADSRTAGIPIVVIERNEAAIRKEHLESRFARLKVLPNLEDPAKMKSLLELRMGSAPVPAPEANAQRQRALEWLARLARGEFPSVETGPAIDGLAQLLPDPKDGPIAAEILGYLPGAESQQLLADAVLNVNRPLATRLAAADALARNIQRTGPGLTRRAADALAASLGQTADPQLQPRLIRVLAALGYRGNPSAAPVPTPPPSSSPPPPPAPGESQTGDQQAPADKPAASKKAATKKGAFFDDE